MTDNEVIKALECCADEYIHSCDYCPFEKECYGDNLNLVKYALDLINRLKTKNNQLDETIQQLAEEINRQKAENEKLTEDYNNLIYEKDLLFDEAEAQIKAKKAEIEKLDAENDCLVKELDKQCDECVEFNVSQARKKAIEEFAKELINRFSKNNLTQGFYVNISEIDLINLVKEMVGDTE